jgi:hypothetical protein
VNPYAGRHPALSEHPEVLEMVAGFDRLDAEHTARDEQLAKTHARDSLGRQDREDDLIAEHGRWQWARRDLTASFRTWLVGAAPDVAVTVREREVELVEQVRLHVHGGGRPRPLAELVVEAEALRDVWGTLLATMGRSERQQPFRDPGQLVTAVVAGQGVLPPGPGPDRPRDLRAA